MIVDRRTSIQAELADVFGVECLSPVKEPGIAIASPTLKIWPNPSTDWLNIQLPESESIISIFDMQGRLVKRGQFSSVQFAIPVQDFAPGFYWVECVTKNGRSREKLVVTR